MAEEGVIILCFRVGNPEVLIVEGMSKVKCERCGHLVWIAPSSVKMREKLKAKVVCDVCEKLSNLERVKIFPLTNEQITEIKDALWNRKTRN